MYPVCSLCSQCVPSKDFLKENSETLNIKRKTNCKKTRRETLYPAPSVFLIVPVFQCVPSVISTVCGVPSVYPVCSLCSQRVPSKDFLKENSDTLNIKWGTNSEKKRRETLYPDPSVFLMFSVCSLYDPHCWSCSQCVTCVFPIFPYCSEYVPKCVPDCVRPHPSHQGTS